LCDNRSRAELAALGKRPAPGKYKLDVVENIPPNETISLYRNGWK
jgi:hypothetical protein